MGSIYTDDEPDEPFYDEATDRGPDEPWLRDRCVIPGTCIVPDPYHGPEECHTGEDVAAYEAGLRGDSFDLGGERPLAAP